MKEIDKLKVVEDKNDREPIFSELRDLEKELSSKPSIQSILESIHLDINGKSISELIAQIRDLKQDTDKVKDALYRAKNKITKLCPHTDSWSEGGFFGNDYYCRECGHVDSDY
jgi:hypothetical protein